MAIVPRTPNVISMSVWGGEPKIIKGCIFLSFYYRVGNKLRDIQKNYVAKCRKYTQRINCGSVTEEVSKYFFLHTLRLEHWTRTNKRRGVARLLLE